MATVVANNQTKSDDVSKRNGSDDVSKWNGSDDVSKWNGSDDVSKWNGSDDGNVLEWKGPILDTIEFPPELKSSNPDDNSPNNVPPPNYDSNGSQNDPDIEFILLLTSWMVGIVIG
jgi:hypothetical protein